MQKNINKWNCYIKNIISKILDTKLISSKTVFDAIKKIF